MSILGLGLGLLFPAAGIGGLIFKFGARAVFGKARDTLKGVNWKVAGPVLLALAAVVYILILRGEVQHRDKTIAGQAVWEKTIMSAVSKGVGSPVPKEHAAAQIDAAFGNVKTLSAAIDRQNAALLQSATDAAARDTAAKAAVEPTSEQRARDTTRKALVDPKRSAGLSDKEWGQL